MTKAVDELSVEEPIEVVSEELSFELTDKDIPKTTRGRANVYAEKLDEFLAQPKDSKYIQFSGRKPVTVASGLRKAIETKGLHDKVTVVTRNSGTDLWLVRI